MITPELLGRYLGGVAIFTQSVDILLPHAVTIKKGDHRHITPGLIHMVATGIVPPSSLKLVLRQIEQLEDSEIIALAGVAVPRDPKMLGSRRTITRQGKGPAYTIEVSLGKDDGLGREQTFVINAACAPALSDICYPPFGGNPVVTHLALHTQVNIFDWLLSKHIDVFGLVRKGQAVYREFWTAGDYETPESLSQKYS